MCVSRDGGGVLLGQFSQFGVVYAFPLSQLGGEEVDHDVLEKHRAAELPLLKILQTLGTHKWVLALLKETGI